MKREDLKAKMLEAGVADDKLSGLLDYVMAQNGAEINALKEEITAAKGVNDETIKSLKEENASLKSKIDGYKDYEDLKKFKEDSIANAENEKRVNFLKDNGCKHPDLVMSKLDFSKAKYDDEKKTYTGLDEDIKGLKESYKDLFEIKVTQQVDPQNIPNPTDSDFMTRYKKEHPELDIK